MILLSWVNLQTGSLDSVCSEEAWRRLVLVSSMMGLFTVYWLSLVLHKPQIRVAGVPDSTLIRMFFFMRSFIVTPQQRMNMFRTHYVVECKVGLKKQILIDRCVYHETITAAWMKKCDEVSPADILFSLDWWRLVSHRMLLDDPTLVGKFPKCLYILAAAGRFACLIQLLWQNTNHHLDGALSI